MNYLVLFLSLVSLSLFAQQKTTTSFMPDNNLHLQDGLFDNGMTQNDFNKIIESVEIYYAPIVKSFGAKLVINRKWSDTTVNAQAYQKGTTWYVDMFGGLARRPEITFDGFAMVLCHEIGHHLAGYPFVEDWAANEGQSDYFAMHSCAKTIWTTTEEVDTVDPVVDPVAKKICDQYAPDDLNLCYREMNAGYSLASLLGALNGMQVAFNTPDKTKVKKTASTHPNAQCRLDTYVAGTICNIAWDNSIIPQTESESSNYLCTDAVKARPRCWFKPKVKNEDTENFL